MNIAYFSHYFVPEIGAPSARIYDLSRQWLKLNHHVEVITCFPNHPTGRLYPGYQSQWYHRESLDGIVTHRNWSYITPNRGFVKKTIGHLSYLAGARFNERHFGPFDVVIGTSPTFFAAMAAASFARRRKIPFIMEVRDLWPAIFVELGVLRNPQLIGLLEKRELSLYRQAQKIVVVTKTFRDNLISRGVSEEKVVSIPNGADVEFWQPQRNSHQLREKLGLAERFVVLYIGAHGISHGLDRVLDAAHELQDHSQVCFLFVGDGAEKQKLEQRAQQLGIRNVTFMGAVGKEEVRDYYQLADLCLVPLKNIPLFETFIPSKLFEMMAMARPIIGSVRGESAEILQRSGSAIVVEPENSKQLADAILDLSRRSPADRQEMGERGRNFVVAHYSRRALAEAYLEVLEQAIASAVSRH